MFEKPPPREIISLVNFPPGERVEYNKMKMHNRLLHKAELLYKKETGKKKRINPYKVGDKVLIKNRQLPSSIAVSYTHLDVYKRQD